MQVAVHGAHAKLKEEGCMTRPMTLLLIVCAISVLAAGVSAADMAVSIADVSGASGSSIDIPILVKDAQNLGSVDISVTYDPSVLNVISVEKGSANKGMISSKTDVPGVVSIGIVDAAGITGSGDIAVMRCKIVGAAITVSPLTITSVKAYDAKTFNDIKTIKSSGTLTVKGKGLGVPGFEAAIAVLAFAGVMVITFRRR